MTNFRRARVLSTFACLCALACNCGNAAGLRDHLSLFFEFAPEDSVVSLAQKSSTQLQIEVEDLITADRRTLWTEVGAGPMEKLLADAKNEGVKVVSLSRSKVPSAEGGVPAAAAEGDDEEDFTAAEPPKRTAASVPPVAPGAGRSSRAKASPDRKSRSLSSQRKNRIWYIGNQTALSTGLYGVAIPIALDIHSWKVVATPMIVAPLAFGAHLLYAKNSPFEDAHLKGTTYLSMAALGESYGFSIAMLGLNFNGYRAGSFLGMAAYPLGLWAGYGLGDQFVDMPGRIAIQSNFFIGFAALGLLTPLLYFERPSDHDETLPRLMAGQAAVFAAGGHFLAQYYRSGENVPEGVSMGFMNHTMLGVGLGMEVAALADAGSARPWAAGAILGGTAGFAEGLYYYRDKYDSRERGYYNSLGEAAGLLMGGGFLILFTNDNMSGYAQKVTAASCLVGGAWLGYWATNFMTEGMEDRGAAAADSWTNRLTVNLIPVPEPQIRDRDAYLRYRVPGITYRW